VGNLTKWTIASPPLYNGPEQTDLMCVVACCAFCIWKANFTFEWFFNPEKPENPEMPENPEKPTQVEWVDMRRYICMFVSVADEIWEKQFKHR
jgi:hypothetical protein